MENLPHISHDYETYSELDVTEVGAWAYSQHPSTEVISWAITVEDEDPELWLPLQRLPDTVQNPDRYVWHAWNNFFEWCIWHNTLKLPALSPHNQCCTQAMALALALPRTLAKCGEVLGLPDDLVKNPRGKELIDLLCKPDKKTGERNHDPDLLEEFYEYNKQDTIAERAIKRLVRPLIPKEYRLWQIDLDMNIRGVPLDTDLLHSAAKVYEKTKAPLKQLLIERTGLANPNSGPQFKRWLAEQGHTLPNLQKPTIEQLISECKDPELIKTVKWRSALARTPLTKYGKIIDKMGSDGRFHGALSYHVATPGRWSSTGVNFQNLNHPTLEQPEIEECIEALKLGDAPFISALYDDPIEAMSSCLRGILCATPGHRLVVADYSAIEARVIAWLAGQTDKLEVFSGHGKIYEHAAAAVFGVPLDQVTKTQRMAGKVSELACGFQGAYRALLKMALQKSIDMEALAVEFGFSSAVAFAKHIVAKWRKANKYIERLWHATERAAIRAVLEPGTVQRVNKYGAFKCIKGMLLFQLPSGRQLAFFNPTITEGKYGDPQVSYWCINSKTHKWSKKHGYGGDFVQSWTQGTARDIMAHAMPGLASAGYPMVLLVHDEIIAEVPDGHGSLDEMVAIMCDKPAWAEGLPVAADGFESVRYRKD